MSAPPLCRPVHAARTARGFTLIELMIAVAIVAIIGAVAFPSYMNSVRKGRRSDAMAAVAAIQLAQERWRSNNPSYTTTLSNLGVTEPTLYSLTLTAPTASVTSLGTGYVVVAEGRAAQASDEQCKRMSVRMVDGNFTYAACSTCSTFTYAATNPCWSR